MWTRKLSIQLNLAHVARKNIRKEETNQTNASAPLIQYRLRYMKAVGKESERLWEERICERDE